jgi:hypothetical protein
MNGTFRRQHPVKGGRKPLPACVLRQIWDRVDKLSRKHEVSRSFVIAVALADQFGIADQEQYLTAPPKAQRVA